MVALDVKRAVGVVAVYRVVESGKSTKAQEMSGFWSVECSFLEWSLLSLFDTAFFSFGESY